MSEATRNLRVILNTLGMELPQISLQGSSQIVENYLLALGIQKFLELNINYIQPQPQVSQEGL